MENVEVLKKGITVELIDELLIAIRNSDPKEMAKLAVSLGHSEQFKHMTSAASKLAAMSLLAEDDEMYRGTFENLAAIAFSAGIKAAAQCLGLGCEVIPVPVTQDIVPPLPAVESEPDDALPN